MTFNHVSLFFLLSCVKFFSPIVHYHYALCTVFFLFLFFLLHLEFSGFNAQMCRWIALNVGRFSFIHKSFMWRFFFFKFCLIVCHNSDPCLFSIQYWIWFLWSLCCILFLSPSSQFLLTNKTAQIIWLNYYYIRSESLYVIRMTAKKRQ